MSKTRFVQYRGDGFWASDFIVSVFLKHLIDRASAHGEEKASSWLNDCISDWRVIAVVSDYGLEFDSKWSEEERQIILRLIDEACATLEAANAVSEEESASWTILDGQGIWLRGHTRIPTAPVVEIGR